MKKVYCSLAAFCFLTLSSVKADKKVIKKRPNILFAIADDISYPFMSVYGTKCVHTPAFDEVARRGQLFLNAYVTSPGSSPSRASILTGDYTWHIEEAGTHGSYFPSKLQTYVDIFKNNGYKVGYTGKGWSPGNWKSCRKENPAGPEYNDIHLTPPYSGIWYYDYLENFKKCLSERKDDQPFCFWYGAKEAHRGYEKDSWKKEGLKLEDVDVPKYLPDSKEVRGDILDYAVEIQWFDKQLGKILRYLEEIGELDNTFIVVTADNGMPFPAAKANCFEAGVHVPMAICMGDKLKREKPVTDVVSTIDLAATFLDIAGIKKGANMVSESLLPWLEGKKKKNNQLAFFAREHHADARYGGVGYPVRGVRMGNYVYLYNFEPNRWPAGDPKAIINKNGMTKLVDAFRDIDGSPSKQYLLSNRDNDAVKPYFIHATAKRQQEELYDLSKDSQCMNNLAYSDKYTNMREKLHDILFSQLKKTKDSRLVNPEIWDSYPYFGSKVKYSEQD